jgi:hypothetical protein
LDRFLEERLSKHFEDPDVLRYLTALAKLFLRPYWTRIWIVQEIIVARSSAAYRGEHSTSAEVLVEAQRVITTQTGSTGVRWVLQGLPYDAPSRMALSRGGLQPIATSRDGVLSGKLTLYDGIQLNFSKRATDARDMIYGLVGFGKCRGHAASAC